MRADCSSDGGNNATPCTRNHRQQVGDQLDPSPPTVERPPPPAAARSAPVAQTGVTQPWSQEQDEALVIAVQMYPMAAATDRNARWTKIANMVGQGRARRECYDRFRELSEKQKVKRSRPSRRHAPAPVDGALAPAAEGKSETHQVSTKELSIGD